MSVAHPTRNAIVVAAAAALAGCDQGLPEAPRSPTPAQVTIQAAQATTLTSLGDTVRLTAVVRDGEGSILPDAPVSWASATSRITFAAGQGNGAATADTATGPTVLAEAVSNGLSWISATSGGASGELLLEVRQAAATVTIIPALLDTLFFRDTVRLSAAASDARGHPLTDPGFTWSIAPPPAGQCCYTLEFVTQVYSDGGFAVDIKATGASVLVYPDDDGTSQVQATSGSSTAGVTVSARRRIVAIAIEPNPIAPLDPGGYAEVAVTTADSHGGSAYLDLHNVTLTSSDPSVLEVVLGLNEADEPQFYAVARTPGRAVLTASLTTVDGTFSATAPVTVKAAQ